MKDLVFKGESNQVLTNSLLVAEKFGKEHQHVLRDVRNLINGGGCPKLVIPMHLRKQLTFTLRTDKNILCS